VAVTLVKDADHTGFLDITDDASLDFGDVDFSWFAWTRPQNLTLNHWISKGTPDEEDSNYTLFDDSVWKSGISPSDGNPANDTISNDGPGANIDEWHHVGGDHDGGASDIDVFEDGVGAAGGRKADVVAPAANALKLDLGKLGTQGTDGNMAWATVWRKRLSQEQLDAMKKGVNPFAIEPDTKELLMPLTGFGGGIIRVWGLTKDLDIEDFSTYTTQAEADACWPTTDTTNMRVNISTNLLKLFALQSSSNRSVGFDLGFTLDDKWVMRFKSGMILDIRVASTILNLGLSELSAATRNIDRDGEVFSFGALYFRWVTGGSGGNDLVTTCRSRQGGSSTRQTGTLKVENFGGNPTTRTHFFQIKWNAPVCIFQEYSDSSFTTLFSGHTLTTLFDPEFLRKLRYVVGSNRFQTGGAGDDTQLTENVDDIQIWNGVGDLDELTGDFAKEPDWSSKRNHADPHQVSKFSGNPPVELLENYL